MRRPLTASSLRAGDVRVGVFPEGEEGEEVLVGLAAHDRFLLLLLGDRSVGEYEWAEGKKRRL
jgi:hypothetical protein